MGYATLHVYKPKQKPKAASKAPRVRLFSGSKLRLSPQTAAAKSRGESAHRQTAAAAAGSNKPISNADGPCDGMPDDLCDDDGPDGSAADCCDPLGASSADYAATHTAPPQGNWLRLGAAVAQPEHHTSSMLEFCLLQHLRMQLICDLCKSAEPLQHVFI